MLKFKNNINEIGIDEAGRGPLIGRVYAGAVIWDQKLDCKIINDSKKLTKNKRKKALEWIHQNIKYWGVGYADEKEIDNINILNATKLAMDRAIEDLKKKYNKNVEYLLIDGCNWENKFSNYNIESIVKGDSKYYSIAAASIIAKEYHDMHIKELVDKNPIFDTKYDLLKNMGYPTKNHIQGIENHGITNYHRQSFNRCKNKYIKIL
jgi:ribonuclease HII